MCETYSSNKDGTFLVRYKGFSFYERFGAVGIVCRDVCACVSVILRTFEGCGIGVCVCVCVFVCVCVCV